MWKTKQGYMRDYDKKTNRQRFVHCIVWEQYNGSIPKGMQVHHKDGNKQNNNINNLILVDATTHKRLHSGCKIIDGVWWKPCKKCGEMLPITSYYKKGRGVHSYCKNCVLKESVLFKQKIRKKWKEEGIRRKY